jgi:hypothetical protein
MKLLRAHLDDAVLREALDQAPPGIIDPRSWSYWNVRVGRYPCRCRLKPSLEFATSEEVRALWAKHGL